MLRLQAWHAVELERMALSRVVPYAIRPTLAQVSLVAEYLMIGSGLLSNAYKSASHHGVYLLQTEADNDLPHGAVISLVSTLHQSQYVGELNI